MHIPFIWKSSFKRSMSGYFCHIKFLIFQFHYVTNHYTYKGFFVELWKYMIEFHFGWGPYEKSRLLIIRIGLDYNDYLNWKFKRRLKRLKPHQVKNLKEVLKELSKDLDKHN